MVQHRKIIHVDLDFFFAQVEVVDNPDLKGKPVIISGPPNSRSVVSTASYEARAFGVHAGMPAFMAYEKCPEGIFIIPRMSRYVQVSKQIHLIFKKYSDIIEPMGLDEAYIDVTINKKGIKSATQLGQMMQNEIYNVLNMTCSIGVSYNKMIAKIASDFNKPAGITVVTPKVSEQFLRELPLNKFSGIGKKTLEKYNSFGIYKGDDFLKVPLDRATHYFGRSGYNLFYAVRGIDNSHVKTLRTTKSIGCERTLECNITGVDELINHLDKIISELLGRLKRKKKNFKTLTLKLKYADFSQTTRSKTLKVSLKTHQDIFKVCRELIINSNIEKKEIRLIGLSASALINKSEDGNALVFQQIYFDLVN